MQYALPPSGAGCVQRGNVDADIALLESLLAIPEQDTADFVANLEQLTQSNPALGDRVNREAKNATEQVEDTLQKQDLLVAIGIDRLHRSRLYALVCRVALRYKRSQGSTFRAMASRQQGPSTDHSADEVGLFATQQDHKQPRDQQLQGMGRGQQPQATVAKDEGPQANGRLSQAINTMKRAREATSNDAGVAGNPLLGLVNSIFNNNNKKRRPYGWVIIDKPPPPISQQTTEDIALLTSLMKIPEPDKAAFIAAFKSLSRNNSALADKVKRCTLLDIDSLQDTIQRQENMIARGLDPQGKAKLYAIVCQVAIRAKRSESAAWRVLDAGDPQPWPPQQPQQRQQAAQQQPSQRHSDPRIKPQQQGGSQGLAVQAGPGPAPAPLSMWGRLMAKTRRGPAEAAAPAQQPAEQPRGASNNGVVAQPLVPAYAPLAANRAAANPFLAARPLRPASNNIRSLRDAAPKQASVAEHIDVLESVLVIPEAYPAELLHGFEQITRKDTWLRDRVYKMAEQDATQLQHAVQIHTDMAGTELDPYQMCKLHAMVCRVAIRVKQARAVRHAQQVQAGQQPPQLPVPHPQPAAEPQRPPQAAEPQRAPSPQQQPQAQPQPQQAPIHEPPPHLLVQQPQQANEIQPQPQSSPPEQPPSPEQRSVNQGQQRPGDDNVKREEPWPDYQSIKKEEPWPEYASVKKEEQCDVKEQCSVKKEEQIDGGMTGFLVTQPAKLESQQPQQSQSDQPQPQAPRLQPQQGAQDPGPSASPGQRPGDAEGPHAPRGPRARSAPMTSLRDRLRRNRDQVQNNSPDYSHLLLI